MQENSDPSFKEIDQGVFLYNTLDARLGSGTFGSVYKGRVIDPSGKRTEVAIKTFNNRNFRDTEIEAKLMQELDHPNIVKVIKTGNSRQHGFYLAMELCDTTLKGYLEKHQMKKFKEEDAGPLFRDICEGIKYLQSKAILHRDLKMDNIMITKDLVIKIGDFGLAKLLEDDITSTTCGSPHIMAPEIFRKEPYGMESDIWSLGVLLFGMVTGEECLFRVNKLEYERRILNFTSVPFKQEWPLSDEVKSLIAAMLQPDSRRRLPIEYVIQHPWLKQFDMGNDLMASQAVLKTIVQSSSSPDRIPVKLAAKLDGIISKELYTRQHAACGYLEEFMSLMEEAKGGHLLTWESIITLKRAIYVWIKSVVTPTMVAGQADGNISLLEPEKQEIVAAQLNALKNYLLEIRPNGEQVANKYCPVTCFIEAIGLLLDSVEYLSYEDTKESLGKVNWEEVGEFPRVLMAYKLARLFLDILDSLPLGAFQIADPKINISAVKDYLKYSKASEEKVVKQLQLFKSNYRFTPKNMSTLTSSQHDETVCSLMDFHLVFKKQIKVEKSAELDTAVGQLKSRLESRLAELKQNVYLRNV